MLGVCKARVVRKASAACKARVVSKALAECKARVAWRAWAARWWLHVGNVILNTGVGLFLGLGYRHWGAGAWNAFGGSAIGEAIILTQPTGSIEDLRRYREGAFETAR